MPRGRKPTPRNLRLVKGTDRPDRHNQNEPVVPVSVPEPPDNLTDDEAEKFREMAAKLANMRVMTEQDVDALAFYCVNFCRWVEATDIVKAGGMMVKSRQGHPMQNPYLSIANRAQSECQKLLSEFGMTPSSRTRVHAK